MLYDDDDKETAEALRPSVVAKAERSFAAVTKQTTSRTPDGLPRSPKTPSKSPPRRASPSPSPRAPRPSRKRPSNSSIAPVPSRPFRPQEFASANQRIAHRESRKLRLAGVRAAMKGVCKKNRHVSVSDRGARSRGVAEMFRRLREFYRRHIAADVPIEMDLCLVCGELECSETRFAECPRRKARAAELAASIGKEKSKSNRTEQGAAPPARNV